MQNNHTSSSKFFSLASVQMPNDIQKNSSKINQDQLSQRQHNTGYYFNKTPYFNQKSLKKNCKDLISSSNFIDSEQNLPQISQEKNKKALKNIIMGQSDSFILRQLLSPSQNEQYLKQKQLIQSMSQIRIQNEKQIEKDLLRSENRDLSFNLANAYKFRGSKLSVDLDKKIKKKNKFFAEYYQNQKQMRYENQQQQLEINETPFYKELKNIIKNFEEMQQIPLNIFDQVKNEIDSSQQLITDKLRENQSIALLEGNLKGALNNIEFEIYNEKYSQLLQKQNTTQNDDQIQAEEQEKIKQFNIHLHDLKKKFLYQKLKLKHPHLQSKAPTGRTEILLLEEWLKESLLAIQNIKEEDIKMKLILADEAFNICISEIIRQNNFVCREQGQFLYSIFQNYFLIVKQHILNQIKQKHSLILQLQNDFLKLGSNYKEHEQEKSKILAQKEKYFNQIVLKNKQLQHQISDYEEKEKYYKEEIQIYQKKLDFIKKVCIRYKKQNIDYQIQLDMHRNQYSMIKEQLFNQEKLIEKHLGQKKFNPFSEKLKEIQQNIEKEINNLDQRKIKEEVLDIEFEGELNYNEEVHMLNEDSEMKSQISEHADKEIEELLQGKGLDNNPFINLQNQIKQQQLEEQLELVVIKEKNDIVDKNKIYKTKATQIDKNYINTLFTNENETQTEWKLVDPIFDILLNQDSIKEAVSDFQFKYMFMDQDNAFMASQVKSQALELNAKSIQNRILEQKQSLTAQQQTNFLKTYLKQFISQLDSGDTNEEKIENTQNNTLILEQQISCSPSKTSKITNSINDIQQQENEYAKKSIDQNENFSIGQPQLHQEKQKQKPSPIQIFPKKVVQEDRNILEKQSSLLKNSAEFKSQLETKNKEQNSALKERRFERKKTKKQTTKIQQSKNTQDKSKLNINTSIITNQTNQSFDSNNDSNELNQEAYIDKKYNSIQANQKQKDFLAKKKAQKQNQLLQLDIKLNSQKEIQQPQGQHITIQSLQNIEIQNLNEQQIKQLVQLLKSENIKTGQYLENYKFLSCLSHDLVRFSKQILLLLRENVKGEKFHQDLTNQLHSIISKMPDDQLLKEQQKEKEEQQQRAKKLAQNAKAKRKRIIASRAPILGLTNVQEFDKKTHSGYLIVEKLKKINDKNILKQKQLFPQKFILKKITQLYEEKISMQKTNTQIQALDLNVFVFNSFLNKYGFKNTAEQKYTLFCISILNHLDVIRVNIFAKFMNLFEEEDQNYSIHQLNKYLEGLQFMTQICQTGISVSFNESDQKRYVPYIRAFEYLKKFSDKRLTSYESQDLRNQLEKIKEADPKSINSHGIVNIDLILTEILRIYKLVLHRTKDYVIEAFRAADLDGNNVCDHNEFLLLLRHIEPSKFLSFGNQSREEALINQAIIEQAEQHILQIYYEQADLVITGQKKMSFEKFTALSTELIVFTEESQNRFLSIADNSEVERIFAEQKQIWDSNKKLMMEKLEQLAEFIEVEEIEIWNKIIEKLNERIKKTDQQLYLKSILIALKVTQLELNRLLQQKEATEQEILEQDLLYQDRLLKNLQQKSSVIIQDNDIDYKKLKKSQEKRMKQRPIKQSLSRQGSILSEKSNQSIILNSSQKQSMEEI